MCGGRASLGMPAAPLIEPATLLEPIEHGVKVVGRPILARIGSYTTGRGSTEASAQGTPDRDTLRESSFFQRRVKSLAHFVCPGGIGHVCREQPLEPR